MILPIPADVAPADRDAWRRDLRRSLPRHVVDLACAAWSAVADRLDAVAGLSDAEWSVARDIARYTLLVALDEGASIDEAARRAARSVGLALPPPSAFSREIRPIPGVFLALSPQFRGGSRP